VSRQPSILCDTAGISAAALGPNPAESSHQAEPRSQEEPVEFSESNDQWRPVPSWARFLLRFGFACVATQRKGRRISVISMPCESAAAGLVSLGAMRRRLSLEDANDRAAHFERIQRLAAKPSRDAFLRHKEYRGRFFVEGKDCHGFIRVCREDLDCSRLSNKTKFKATIILPNTATDWHFDGEAPVQTAHGAELPHRQIYDSILLDPPVFRGNLTRSDSWLCLAGRVSGESASKNVFGAIRVKKADEVADLSQLLSIQDWAPRNASRVNFFNTRTARIDRNTGLTRLVVADGDAAFLKVLDSSEFSSSDVVGVIHRAVARESLEAVGFKLSSLTQWYEPEDDQGIPPPVGMTVSTMRQRT
jgi:hypothetical protein